MHADRIFKMMDAGLSFADAVAVDDESAALLIEAWEIAMDGDVEVEITYDQDG
jgi:hypothetical protein